jgi:hypothetical protein
VTHHSESMAKAGSSRRSGRRIDRWHRISSRRASHGEAPEGPAPSWH